jgi:hypothetical protein
MGLYSAVTYVAHFLAGAVLGLVYAGAGFTAVAVVAAAALAMAAGMILLGRLRLSSQDAE